MEKTYEKNKWPILLIVVMSTFMATLDSSIVNVALPQMARVLDVDTSQIQLVVTSYLIVIMGVILIFGKLGDMLGKTKIFIFGIALFTLGSLLCGINSTFTLLIGGRIVQAIGAAATMANNQGIITQVFPSTERGKALGLTGTSVALGSLVGPGLGGIIVGSFSWEYIFLINVPVGVVVLYLAMKLLPKSNKKAKEKLDIPGAILFTLSVVPLFVALGQVQSLGFSDPLILTGFAVTTVSFLAFILVERKVGNPLIPLNIFKNKLFTLSIFCAFINFIGLFCNNIIQPFYLQDVRAYSPSQAGLMMMIFPLILMVLAPVSGYMSDKIGSEILTFIGLLLISLGLFLMSTLTEQSSLGVLISFIVVLSVGMGLFQSPNNSLIMSTVGKHQLGIAGSINALVRNMGMVSGIALATTLLYGSMSSELGYHVTDYVVGQNDAFIHGMKTAYLTAAAITFFGAILTFLRLIEKKSRIADEQLVLENQREINRE
ncbi:MFS transporter [Acetobacterium woodii]|uniref:EmrB-like drug resistance transporter protein n=1 Tax=Acetobacterium woodii (strain ATCC 29683 / DSM 1030 / JCM 2381 / KCTC 1655 / WB1) TaxID=931626 RepID=H6LH46_ACEWD|nr:MFS transporter [Acetobacterium woodii]AFA47184.1 EmrB-like drug resistance transporter protein [Acetobacterium woodii DSM 1030]